MLTDKSHLFIIGSGAIGKALAVFLKLAGREVTVIRGSVDDGSRKTEHIRVEMANGADLGADIEITTLNTLPRINGIVILANKSYGNEHLAMSLRSKTGSSPIVLLQNGLGVEQAFVRHQFPEIYRCVLFVTSQTVDDFTVRFKPVSICPIGIEKGNPDHLNSIVRQLDTPNFGFRSEADIQQIIWKKAIVNCVFNSVCPLLEVDNGVFHRSPEALQIARRIIDECITIAAGREIVLKRDEVEESLLQISKSSDGQLISTLQDIRKNRRTEIDTLNFEIVRIAEELGKSELVRETRILGELIKLKSFSKPGHLHDIEPQ